MNIIDNAICPECGGSMFVSGEPQMMRCEYCGHSMSTDEVRAIEEDPFMTGE